MPVGFGSCVGVRTCRRNCSLFFVCATPPQLFEPQGCRHDDTFVFLFREDSRRHCPSLSKRNAGYALFSRGNWFLQRSAMEFQEEVRKCVDVILVEMTFCHAFVPLRRLSDPRCCNCQITLALKCARIHRSAERAVAHLPRPSEVFQQIEKRKIWPNLVICAGTVCVSVPEHEHVRPYMRKGL